MDPQTFRKNLQKDEFFTAATLGVVDGVQVIEVVGYNEAVPANTLTTLWPEGGVYEFPAAPEQMELVSSDAGDTSVDCLLTMLDSDFNEVLVPVQTNGTTPVQIQGGPYLRINRIFNIAPSEGAAGDITVRSIGGGNVYAVALAENQATSQAVFTVPAGKTGFITRVQNALNRPSNQTEATIRYTTQRQGSPKIRISRWGLTNRATGVSNVQIVQSQRLPEKLDVTVEVTSNQPDADVTAAFTVVLFDNHLLMSKD